MGKLLNLYNLTNPWPNQPMINTENQPVIHIDSQHMVQHHFGPHIMEHNVILPDGSVHSDKFVKITSRLIYAVIHFVLPLLN